MCKKLTYEDADLSTHFIGVDAGGTTTRALVAKADGAIVGVGRAPGANTWSSGTSVSHVIIAALRAALHEIDPSTVAGGVIAVAGAATARPSVTADIYDAWHGLGLGGSPDLLPDVVAAYAAGTTRPDGVVLVAGTGAIAAAINHGRVTRRAGGHGWMVGDEGSAVWLGLEAIRAALRAIDGTGPDTTLVTAISEKLHIGDIEDGSPARQIISAAHSQPPAQLGLLAPAIVEACDQGDPVARRLIEEAARHLCTTIAAAAGSQQPPAAVLAGSVLTKAAPIRRLVYASLTERWPETSITETTSGEAGAVALAIARYQGTPVTDATLARLRGETAESS